MDHPTHSIFVFLTLMVLCWHTDKGYIILLDFDGPRNSSPFLIEESDGITLACMCKSIYLLENAGQKFLHLYLDLS